MRFHDRTEAGRRLGAALQRFHGQPVVVLGLPRGGVPVALEVALALDAPLDVIVVRKLGVPMQPELGLGAIGEDGVRVINDEVVRLAGVRPEEIAHVEARERDELERRARRFRGERARVPLDGQIALVVDDGIATGSTARAACQVARAHGADRVVLAVPVAPDDWESRLRADADELIALETPRGFMSVGQFYRDFSQTTDDEVVRCLARSPHLATRIDEEVEISVDAVRLEGHLTVPEGAVGLVLFAHGSGSSRHSPRNQFVASVLQDAGIGTLLFDLLTRQEEQDRRNVFDIALLGGRLAAATEWANRRQTLADLRFAYFGASTGAAAALWAAAERGSGITAVVSRGGRPDLAGDRLPTVTAPTLLIVGGRDTVVLDLNRDARAAMTCESRLVIIPGATHLFEEPGTLEAAALTARDWFLDHLRA
ncbi:MAG: phosphoribosyltransferase family protein [Ilumatobacteraceae bacterium]